MKSGEDAKNAPPAVEEKSGGVAPAPVVAPDIAAAPEVLAATANEGQTAIPPVAPVELSAVGVDAAPESAPVVAPAANGTVDASDEKPAFLPNSSEIRVDDEQARTAHSLEVTKPEPEADKAVSPISAADVPAHSDANENSEIYVGDATWEERAWKELIKLKEDMFWARVGGLR